MLGFDLRDTEQLERHWPTITNTDAIAVNRDYAGFSGSLFDASAELTSFQACDWTANVTCEWPTWTAWYKPLSGTDSRGSTMAVLLMNNGVADRPLGFAWAVVPTLGNATACVVYDVWQQMSLGRVEGAHFTTAHAVPPRDSAFLTLARCEY